MSKVPDYGDYGALPFNLGLLVKPDCLQKPEKCGIKISLQNFKQKYVLKNICSIKQYLISNGGQSLSIGVSGSLFEWIKKSTNNSEFIYPDDVSIVGGIWNSYGGGFHQVNIVGWSTPKPGYTKFIFKNSWDNKPNFYFTIKDEDYNNASLPIFTQIHQSNYTYSYDIVFVDYQNKSLNEIRSIFKDKIQDCCGLGTCCGDAYNIDYCEENISEVECRKYQPATLIRNTNCDEELFFTYNRTFNNFFDDIEGDGKNSWFILANNSDYIQDEDLKNDIIEFSNTPNSQRSPVVEQELKNRVFLEFQRLSEITLDCPCCHGLCVYYFEADCSNHKTWEIKKDDENKPILYYDCVDSNEDLPESDNEDRYWKTDNATLTLKYFFSAAKNPDGSPRPPQENDPMPWLCSEDDNCKNADQNYINQIVEIAQDKLDEVNENLLDPDGEPTGGIGVFFPDHCVRWTCLGPEDSNHPYLSIKKCRKFHTIPQNVLDSIFPDRDPVVLYDTEEECEDACGLLVILDVKISDNLEFTIGKLSLTQISDTDAFSIPLKECGSEDPDPPYEPNTYTIGDVLTDVSFLPGSNALTFKKVSTNFNIINTGNIIIPITDCVGNSTTENRGLDNTEVLNGNVIPLICSAVLDSDGLKFVQIHIPGSIFDDVKNIDIIEIPLMSCSNV